VSLVMCDGPLPVALVPSWQLTQLLVIPVWLKPVAGVHAVGEWQFWQLSSAAGWPTGLPAMTGTDRDRTTRKPQLPLPA
jgi:hypothetical protein